jgi:hypothetical protein
MKSIDWYEKSVNSNTGEAMGRSRRVMRLRAMAGSFIGRQRWITLACEVDLAAAMPVTVIA